jgi:hypothetical protein
VHYTISETNKQQSQHHEREQQQQKKRPALDSLDSTNAYSKLSRKDRLA